MNFWIIAVVLLIVSAAAFCWPMFAGNTKDRIVGILILLILPVAGLSLYQVVGTPEAINMPAATPQQTAQAQQPHSSGEGEIDALLQQLNQRLTENPNDPDGWLILGRTLKTQQRYAEAETALDNANRLMPETPMIMVELAEARLFASGKREISDDVKQLLEAAIAIDPHQQKGLWILGMAAFEAADYATAISNWQTLLGLLEPESGPAQRVAAQIAQTQAMLGEPVVTPAPPAADQPVSPAAVAETGIPVTITIAADLAGTVPANATLFAFVHPTGGAGMPLAVKRLAAPGFPMSLTFTDADLLQPGASLQDFEQLDISARIALGGTVNPTSGDIQANMITLETKAIKAIALHLDQRLP